MFLILYLPREYGISQSKKATYEIVGAWDVKEALVQFYESLDSKVNMMKVDLFRTLVKAVSLYDAVELYNTISTMAHITAIYDGLHEVDIKEK